MNYKLLYDKIVNRRKIEAYDGYTENHHVLPKSIGGTDATSNLVALSAKEHYICHLLLTKIYATGDNHYKMIKAFLMMSVMSNDQPRFKSARAYANLREKYAAYKSIAVTGKNNPQFGKIWISNPVTGETIRVDKNSELPAGWVLGRNRKYQVCKFCNLLFLKSYRSATCSKKCEKDFKSQEKFKYWKNNNDNN